MSANYKLLRVYQDCVNQNPGTHLDGSIEDDDKWKKRCKNLILCPPNAMTYRLAGSEIGMSGFFQWSST